MTRKLITHHFFCLLSFETHGIAPVARLQREEVSRSAKEHEELVHFLQDFTGALHPLFLQITLQMLIKSTGSTASFKAHGKYTANLITINQQWCSFPISRQWHFH
jgi:hypothetical protein